MSDDGPDYGYSPSDDRHDEPPPCFDEGRCVGHEAYPGAGTFGLIYCDEDEGGYRVPVYDDELPEGVYP